MYNPKQYSNWTKKVPDFLKKSLKLCITSKSPWIQRLRHQILQTMRGDIHEITSNCIKIHTAKKLFLPFPQTLIILKPIVNTNKNLKNYT